MAALYQPQRISGAAVFAAQSGSYVEPPQPPDPNPTPSSARPIVLGLTLDGKIVIIA